MDKVSEFECYNRGWNEALEAVRGKLRQDSNKSGIEFIIDELKK